MPFHLYAAKQARALAHYVPMAEQAKAEAAQPDDLASDSPVWKAIIAWGEAQYSAGPMSELRAACAAVDAAVREYAAKRGAL